MLEAGFNAGGGNSPNCAPFAAGWPLKSFSSSGTLTGSMGLEATVQTTAEPLDIACPSSAPAATPRLASASAPRQATLVPPTKATVIPSASHATGSAATKKAGAAKAKARASAGRRLLERA